MKRINYILSLVILAFANVSYAMEKKTAETLQEQMKLASIVTQFIALQSNVRTMIQQADSLHGELNNIKLEKEWDSIKSIGVILSSFKSHLYVAERDGMDLRKVVDELQIEPSLKNMIETAIQISQK